MSFSSLLLLCCSQRHAGCRRYLAPDRECQHKYSSRHHSLLRHACSHLVSSTVPEASNINIILTRLTQNLSHANLSGHLFKVYFPSCLIQLVRLLQANKEEGELYLWVDKSSLLVRETDHVAFQGFLSYLSADSTPFHLNRVVVYGTNLHLLWRLSGSCTQYTKQ